MTPGPQHGDLSRILIIDLEATCWQGGRPPGEEPEIIEIGNAMLYPGEKRVEPGPEVLVQPSRSRVSAFCTELTGITQEDVDQRGLPLAGAMQVLAEAHGELADLVWGSFGDYDREKLVGECVLHGLPFALSEAHINIKRLVAQAYGWPKERGMMRTLHHLGLEPLPGSRHHRGADDALNIGRILAHVYPMVAGMLGEG